MSNFAPDIPKTMNSMTYRTTLLALMACWMTAAPLAAQEDTHTDTASEQAVAGKVSPQLGLYLRERGYEGAGAREYEGAGARMLADTREERLQVLVKLADDASEAALAEAYGMTVERRIGRVLVVSVPADNVGLLAADGRVLRVEGERMPRPLLDQVPRQIGSDRVNVGTAAQGIQAFTGKGVVVGIVDSGFDFVNPFFRDGQGKTRVRWAADYMTGKRYTTTTAVTAAMHSSDADDMLHGTHVAGIAAGSRVNDINDEYYQGVAPEADIAEGAVNSEITSSGLNSAQALTAFADIFDYAKEQGKPCVINFSMGDAMSFVDNRQLEEEAIRTLLQEPGRAIVVASGNAGGTSRLAHKEAAMDEGGCGVWFNDDEQYGSYFGIEVKMKPGQTLRLRATGSNYRTNSGEVEKTVDELEGLTTLTLGSKRLTVQQRGRTADGYVVVYLTAGMSTYSTSDRVLVTIKGEGEAWVYADPLCAQLENVPAQYLAGHDLAQEGYSMTWPAQMDEVVSVGNIAHRLKIVTMANKYASQGGVATPTDLTPIESTRGEGFLARSSSVGPALDGSMKPDVCAPGVNIVSAYNNFVNESTDMQYAAWMISILDTEYEPDYGGYFVTLAQTGTSMSAPVVTGTIALWMQADPTLTTGRIKDILAHASRRPDAALAYPNNQYGHGEIDAYQGLLYLLGISKVEGISMQQPAAASFRLEGRLLKVVMAAGDEAGGADPIVKVIALDGRVVAQGRGTSLDLTGLPQGVYAVQLNTGQARTTGSTLIRL